MIKNIKKIKNFGIFLDSTVHDVPGDFLKFNLIYGWNGSGKSTFSRLLDAPAQGIIPVDYHVAEFQIEFDDGHVASNANISSGGHKLYVFNQDFIKRNINWNDVSRSILILSKEKIEEKKKLDELRERLKGDDQLIKAKEISKSSIEKSIDEFLIGSARAIKQSLQVIDSKDSYYLNYDKRKLKTFIGTTQEQLGRPDSRIPDDALEAAIQAAKPQIKSKVVFPQVDIDLPRIKKAHERIKEIVRAVAVSETINRLADNSDIQAWVLQGISIHQMHSSQSCEYCTNQISDLRLAELSRHFNKQFSELKESVEKAISWLGTQLIDIEVAPNAELFYDEFRGRYLRSLGELKNAVVDVNDVIVSWKRILELKKDDMYRSDFVVTEIQEDAIESARRAITEIGEITRENNNKTDNFEVEIRKNKERLELHYSSVAASEFDYNAKNEEFLIAKNELEEMKGSYAELSRQAKEIEQSLSDEGIGATEFNEDLHRFLGRQDISLVFDKGRNGYRIIRLPSGKPASDLSEGEKTAIAFVYFSVKTKENNNNASDLIIVIDDPISSFDSNHIFHAYSFLKKNFEQSRQLLVLTHNFTFFKLVRDWMSGKNKKDRDGILINKSAFFQIDCENNGVRSSKLRAADRSILDYNSEYHYIFKRIRYFKDHDRLSIEDAFTVANLSRKLLESFLAFKFPKHRNDFRVLMDKAINDVLVREKIYKFINKYSHSRTIEVDGDAADNILGESTNVVIDIMACMEDLDSVHFQEMIEVCG